ncbi:MAG: SDR family NAD(P)-dependent oxidoreductase [Planctomycetota bacterium]|nr:SDR family NAD(P)-dependent oxidoreductase [Planctomycetota bacterium]
MNEFELQGRTALVTGGAKGIGRACCQRLAAAGSKVAVNYLSSEAAAGEVVEQIEAGGGQAIACRADVSSPEQVRAMIDHIQEELGSIDLLVNNAGVFDFLAHDQTSLDVWQRSLNVNLTGCYLTSWAVKDGMIERGFGRIVNISSIAALSARPMSIAYAVSKAGVVGLTKSLAVAVAEHNVRVNAVAPGLIDTEIIASVDRGVLDGLIAATPMKRIGQAAEIAELVLFLLSERSSFMTGQTLVASGGRVTLP